MSKLSFSPLDKRNVFMLLNLSAGLDVGDRKVIEQMYSGCDPPCMLDSQDGRCNTSCSFCTFFNKMCSTCVETDSEYVIGFRYLFK